MKITTHGEQWPVLIGLLTLYLPTFHSLAHGVWNTEEQAHGPLILAGAICLFWRQRVLYAQSVAICRPLLGSFFLGAGLLLYLFGRTYEILMLEMGSLAPVLAGVLLISRGWEGWRACWFAVVLTLFVAPLPGVMVDAITGPLKQIISIIAENTLYLFGYPIARDGVTLVIGPYRLLVADACSGLHSMFSLSALGLLYLYFGRSRRFLCHAVIVASIVPIAFATNVVRVMALLLVTYHFGDAAGQGMAHGIAGFFFFGVALLLLFLLDGLLSALFDKRETKYGSMPEALMGDMPRHVDNSGILDGNETSLQNDRSR